MKQYSEGNKYIEEEGNTRIIKDYTYHFFPDFFKPTMPEYIFFLLEIPFLSSITGGIGCYLGKGNPVVTTLSTLTPQILTYGLFRIAELYSLKSKNKNRAELWKRMKKILPYSPKTTDETIDDVIEED